MVPSWGSWKDRRGQAGRCGPWFPTVVDLFPHPAAASGSGGRQRGPKTETRCQPAVILSQGQK